MHVYLNQEDQQVLNEIKHDLIKLRIIFIRNFKELMIQLYRLILKQLIGFKEYSYTNIKSKGLKTILIERAERFFGLDINQPDKTTRSRPLKKECASKNHFIKRKILFPLYVLIIISLWIRSKFFKKNVIFNKYT